MLLPRDQPHGPSSISDVGQAVPAGVHRLADTAGQLADASGLTTTLRRSLFIAELLARRRAGD